MSNDYSKQVADLITDAFKNLAKAGKEDGKGAHELAAARRHHATLQVQTAQAAATLGLAMEVRAVGLLLASANHAAAEPSPDMAREAYTAAVIHLGLVEAPPEPVDTDTLDALRAALAGKDPADRDVEL